MFLHIFFLKEFSGIVEYIGYLLVGLVHDLPAYFGGGRGMRWWQSHDCHIEYHDFFMDLDFAKRLHENLCTPDSNSLYIYILYDIVACCWRSGAWRSVTMKLLKTKANLGLWNCCVSVGQVLTKPVKGWRFHISLHESIPQLSSGCEALPNYCLGPLPSRCESLWCFFGPRGGRGKNIWCHKKLACNMFFQESRWIWSPKIPVSCFWVVIITYQYPWPTFPPDFFSNLSFSGRSLLAIAVNHYSNFAYTEFGVRKPGGLVVTRRRQNIWLWRKIRGGKNPRFCC